jgi:hypothetical protein
MNYLCHKFQYHNILKSCYKEHAHIWGFLRLYISFSENTHCAHRVAILGWSSQPNQYLRQIFRLECIGADRHLNGAIWQILVFIATVFSTFLRFFLATGTIPLRLFWTSSKLARRERRATRSWKHCRNHTLTWTNDGSNLNFPLRLWRLQYISHAIFHDWPRVQPFFLL